MGDVENGGNILLTNMLPSEAHLRKVYKKYFKDLEAKGICPRVRAIVGCGPENNGWAGTDGLMNNDTIHDAVKTIRGAELVRLRKDGGKQSKASKAAYDKRPAASTIGNHDNNKNGHLYARK